MSRRNSIAVLILALILGCALYVAFKAGKDLVQAVHRERADRSTYHNGAREDLPPRAPSINATIRTTASVPPAAGKSEAIREAGQEKTRLAVQRDLEEVPYVQEALAESPQKIKDLFSVGLTYMRMRKFVEARLAFWTIVRSFPGCTLEAPAYLAVGVSYALEGGKENLMLAADQFENYMIFFPAGDGVPELLQAAQIDLAMVEIQLMQSADGEKEWRTAGAVAAKTLTAFLNQWPDNPQAPTARAWLTLVQYYLARPF
jgi:TolA-binding protein